MRQLVLAIGLTLVLACFPGTTSGLPAAPVDNGMLFGGQWSPAGNATASVTQNLSEMPAVVEVFTATWCENCVDVEHALDEVQGEGWLQQYHIHRAIGETQDPFGTEALDLRWRQKYQPSSPPSVVFNGTMKKIGSVADDGTLANEFTNLAKTDLGLGAGTSTFAWTPIDNVSGTVSWLLDMDETHLNNATLNVSVFVVEGAADFEEGSNGLGTYPHIVRNIQVVGHELEGTATVSLPPAFDGVDLEIHLLYEIVPDPPETAVEETGSGCSEAEGPDCESEDTPALPVAFTLFAALAAVVFTPRKPNSDHHPQHLAKDVASVGR